MRHLGQRLTSMSGSLPGAGILPVGFRIWRGGTVDSVAGPLRAYGSGSSAPRVFASATTPNTNAAMYTPRTTAYWYRTPPP